MELKHQVKAGDAYLGVKVDTEAMRVDKILKTEVFEATNELFKGMANLTEISQASFKTTPCPHHICTFPVCGGHTMLCAQLQRASHRGAL